MKVLYDEECGGRTFYMNRGRTEMLTREQVQGFVDRATDEDKRIHVNHFTLAETALALYDENDRLREELRKCHNSLTFSANEMGRLRSVVEAAIGFLKMAEARADVCCRSAQHSGATEFFLQRDIRNAIAALEKVGRTE